MCKSVQNDGDPYQPKDKKELLMFIHMCVYIYIYIYIYNYM